MKAFKRESGLALVVVLWFIAILSLLALGFSQAMRSDTLTARKLIERIQARELAEAAALRGIYGVLSADERFFDAMINFQRVPVPWAGAELSVELRDENGKVNVNEADELMLEELLVSLELEPAGALALAHAIVDWRDADEARMLHGAERPEYLEADLPRLPANRPFLALEELRQVLGMTPELFTRLAPLVTIYTGTTEINPIFAPPQVLRSLRGTDPNELESFIAARASVGDEEGAAPLLALIHVESLVSDQVGPVYTVVGRAQLPSGTAATRRLVVWVPAERRDRPFYLLESGRARQRAEGSEAKP